MKRTLIALLFGAFIGSTATLAQEPASAPTADPAAGTDYHLELLSLEEDVNSLKERVFRSKATLQLLKEIVIEGSTTGSRATIWHVNKLGASYKVVSITYLLDGQSVYSRGDEDGALSDS